MFICWAVIHETGYDWESTIVEQRNAYVIDPGGHWHRFTAMDRSGYSSMSTMYYTGCWYEMARFQVADGNFSAILPHSADVYESTPLENAKLELLEEQRRALTCCTMPGYICGTRKLKTLPATARHCARRWWLDRQPKRRPVRHRSGLGKLEGEEAARSLVHEQTGIQGRKQSPRPQSVGHWGAATRRCRLPAQRGAQGVR